MVGSLKHILRYGNSFSFIIMNYINQLNKTIFLIIFCFSTLISLAQSQNRYVSIQSKDITIKEAFSQIELQTGYSINHEYSDLDNRISLSLENAKIEQALKKILSDSNLTCIIKKDQIFINANYAKNMEYNLRFGKRQNPDLNSSNKNIYTYSGYVLDSITKLSLPSAIVILLDSHSKIIVSCLTNEEGFFSIKSTKAPSSLKIALLGYKDFTLKLSHQIFNLGELRLIPDEKLLKEIIITSDIVDNKLDRNSYLITDKMRKYASNAQELLDQIHGVHFDKLANSIKVGTESTVLLLVDDIQQSEEYIKNLPTDRISRIEVITEPTGRYLSEGYGAIINFVLKKNYLGYDVNIRNMSMINLSENNGNDWLMNLRPSLGVIYTKDKINIFTNYSYVLKEVNTPVWKVQNYTDLFKMESDIINKDNPNYTYNYLANYIGGGFNYLLNPNHTISYQIDYTFQKINDQTNFRYKVVDIKNNAYTTITSLTQNKTRDQDYVGTIFYKGKIGDDMKTYADFTYNYYSNDIQNNLSQGVNFFQQNFYKERKDYTKFSFEGEYTFNPQIALSIGYVNVWRKYDAKNKKKDTFLNYNEKRNQLFAYLQYKVNEKLIVKFGSSLEYINISNNDRNIFWNIQPYFQLNFKINNKTNLNFSYLTNSYYPTLYQLSPMTKAIDSIMIQSGNPNLKSAVRHTISAKLILWDHLTIRPIFRFTPKRISETYNYNGSNYYCTFANINVKQHIIQAIYDQSLGKYLNLSNTIAYYDNRACYQGIKNKYQGLILNSVIEYFNSKWDFSAKLGYYRNIDKGILLQGYQMINMDYWIISGQKQFWNKRVSFMISYFPPMEWNVRDKLDKKINTSFYNEKYSQSLKPYRNMLIVRIGLRFNKGKPRRSNKASSTERENRIQKPIDF